MGYGDGAVHPRGQLDFKTLRGEASYLIKAYVYGLANGVDRFFYFIFFDYDERESNFGIFNRDFTPRPAYAALCNLTYVLGEGKFVREEKIPGKGVECFIFEDGGVEVAVLWGKERQNVTLGLNADWAEACDVVGRSVPFVKVDGGRFSIAVGPEPIFLKGKKK